MNKPPLRRWQEEAVTAWRASHCHGIAAVVTGGGKTIFALRCIEEYRGSVPAATTVICVPTQALQEQWIDEIALYFGFKTSHVIALSSRKKMVRSRIHVGV